MKKLLLTKEEAALEKENGEWVTVPDMAEEIKKYQNNARNVLKKIKKRRTT